mgnify:CR=1 FL=1
MRETLSTITVTVTPTSRRGGVAAAPTCSGCSGGCGGGSCGAGGACGGGGSCSGGGGCGGCRQ